MFMVAALRSVTRGLFSKGLVGAGLLAFAAPSSAGPIDRPDWELVFQDEFDGPSLDTDAWLALNRQNSFNNEKQYYLADQVTLDNGHLVLTATNQPLANKAYRSGLVDSKTQWSYGRFEARIDLPTSQGMWPAFWLLPDTAEVPWPSGGEIDIMENRGSQPNLVSSAYHWGNDFFDRRFIFDEYAATQPNGQPVDFHAGFHDYAVEWEPGVLRFSVDGHVYQTITGDQATIFDTPKSIILNLAVGGDFGGDPNASTVWPQEMRVDYVRVWQRPEGYTPPITLLANPGFDDNAGSLPPWQTFGNAIGNVSTNNQIARDGSHSLKLYGQFNGTPNASGVFQTLAVTEGDTVTFGASAFTPSFDSIFGTGNAVEMKIEFYAGDDFLEEAVASLLTDDMLENLWHEQSLVAITPTGASQARLVFAFTQPNQQPGAAWIDAATLSLTPLTVSTPLAGDFNGNARVEQGDLDLVLRYWGRSAGPTAPDGWTNTVGLVGFVDQDELDAVLANWGATATPSFAARPGVVPEPGFFALIAGGWVAMLGRRAAGVW